MRESLRTIALVSALAIALLGAAGCGDVAAEVDAAENPAPAGTYEGIDISSAVWLDNKAEYAWEIDGTTYDATTGANTRYKVNGKRVRSSGQYFDAYSNAGPYEGYNEDGFDNLYNFRVQPDGVLIEVDLILGD